MRDQPVEVWLLAGTLAEGPVERQCRVPASKPLLAPVVNLASDVTSCETFMKRAQGEVLLDGSTQTLTKVSATPFTYEARAGNPYGTAAGRINSVGCGLYAWIPAPASGEHELLIRGSGGGKEVDVRYKLIVGAD
ncbi:signal protein [Streptomyces sp. ID05-26A]|nr:signal protein [Streptomyces sp. ID05-26A]